MELNKAEILEGLLSYNYFPAQKKDNNELPPNISSINLTKDVSSQLLRLKLRKEGYDQLEYKISRYNNIPRILSIPHPMPYIYLCHTIHDNWEKLKHICENKNSLVIPNNHADGRIIIMDYENAEEQSKRHIELSHDKKFYVKTDIANYYPSIYSHSIPWSLVGLKNAKQNRSRKEWFNKLDFAQRITKRNETNGIPIGPATSNIICEIILSNIDKLLLKNKFVFFRFVDDYSAFTNTYERAEEFIRVLSEELYKCKLLLNRKKTKIEQLPCPASPDWILDLHTRKPDINNLTPVNIARYMDYAVKLQKNNIEGSILKFATKSIIYDVKNHSAELLLQYLLSLSIKYPILIPQLNVLFNNMELESNFNYGDYLLNILKEQIINKQSDAMSWLIYYLNKYNVTIPIKIAKMIIESKDCMSILQLYLSENYNTEVVKYCNDLPNDDLYQLDKYWLLLYKLYFDNLINNPYHNKKLYKHLYKKDENDKIMNKIEVDDILNNEILIFETLKKNDVSFCSNNYQYDSEFVAVKY